MPIDIYSDPSSRNRTYADRRAFVIAETTEEMVRSIAERSATTQAGGSIAPVVPPKSLTEQARRERALAREQVASRRQEAFLLLLGEAVYRALPLDEHEKQPHRQTILEQTIEFAKASKNWVPTRTAEQLMTEVAVLADRLGPDDDLSAAVSEASATGDFSGLLSELAGEIERRVVAAVAASRAQSEVTESLLEHAAAPSGDAELDAYRRRRALERSKPTLIEALFIANQRSLAEETASAEIPKGVVLTEAVCQYTMLETLNALGILSLADPFPLIERLCKQK